MLLFVILLLRLFFVLSTGDLGRLSHDLFCWEAHRNLSLGGSYWLKKSYDFSLSQQRRRSQMQIINDSIARSTIT